MTPPEADQLSQLMDALTDLGEPYRGVPPPTWLGCRSASAGVVCRHPAREGLLVLASHGTVAVGTGEELRARAAHLELRSDPGDRIEHLLLSWLDDDEAAPRL